MPATPSTAPTGDGGATAADANPGKRERFAWRNRLRRSPTWRRPYRFGVGLLGILMIVAAGFTGPFPGPGGIPLFLLGMAVLASEFHWARRAHRVAVVQVDRYHTWAPARRRTFWVLVVLGILAAWWIGLALVGVPAWVPEPVRAILVLLPGVS